MVDADCRIWSRELVFFLGLPLLSQEVRSSVDAGEKLWPQEPNVGAAASGPGSRARIRCPRVYMDNTCPREKKAPGLLLQPRGSRAGLLVGLPPCPGQAGEGSGTLQEAGREAGRAAASAVLSKRAVWETWESR